MNMVDVHKRDNLLRAIRSQPEHENGRALVSVTEFYNGNDDLGSIGCNLSDHPGLSHFRDVLQSIEARDDVDEIWLQIYDLEEGDWPFSENVLIFGTVPKSAVEQMTKTLQPSEIGEMLLDWTPSREAHLAGRRYINLWWD
jgi:hypothetical protein